jgi:hypothetical protein
VLFLSFKRNSEVRLSGWLGSLQALICSSCHVSKNIRVDLTCSVWNFSCSFKLNSKLARIYFVIIQHFFCNRKEFNFFEMMCFEDFFVGSQEHKRECGSLRKLMGFEWVWDRSAPMIGVAAVIPPTFSTQNVLVACIVKQPEAEHDWLKQLDKMCCPHHTVCARDSKKVA